MEYSGDGTQCIHGELLVEPINDPSSLAGPMCLEIKCGYNSVVEYHVANVSVVGSNPTTRSKLCLVGNESIIKLTTLNKCMQVQYN